MMMFGTPKSYVGDTWHFLVACFYLYLFYLPTNEIQYKYKVTMALQVWRYLKIEWTKLFISPMFGLRTLILKNI
jgi:hypothetical protein